MRSHVLLVVLCLAVARHNAEVSGEVPEQAQGDLPLKDPWDEKKCTCEKGEDQGIGGRLEKVIEDVAANAMLRVASSLSSGCGSNNYNPEVVYSSAGANPDDKRDLATSASCSPIKDCFDLASTGQNKSGVYRVWPEGWSACGMEVYCDLQRDGGGWTVIQRRGKFGNPQDYFFRNWRNYKFGFGNLTKELWLGNDKIHALTNQRNYALRVNLRTHEGEVRHAQYDEFYVEGETNKYRLWVSGYKGDASDSLSPHNGMFFSTKDRKNDNSVSHCAQKYKGAWWYAPACHKSNLNGLYLDGDHASDADGINWAFWKGFHYSFPDVEMKIRPQD